MNERTRLSSRTSFLHFFARFGCMSFLRISYSMPAAAVFLLLGCFAAGTIRAADSPVPVATPGLPDDPAAYRVSGSAPQKLAPA
jgi:hypothetical protein